MTGFEVVVGSSCLDNLRVKSSPSSPTLDLADYPTQGTMDLSLNEWAHTSTGATQVPTPPPSDFSPILDYEPNASVSVSTAFHSSAKLDPQPPDVILVSSDLVLFYVHRCRLILASSNGFDNLLPRSSKDDYDEAVLLSHHSTVINVVLHTIYELPFAQYTPTTQVLMDAVDALKQHGVPLQKYVSPSTRLYELLVFHAPLNPIGLYTLAASHDLHELATAISPHLLSYPLSSLSDEMATRMGPIHLKRLFFLHLGRMEALKRLLLPPPHPHMPTQSCNFEGQRCLTRAWALAVAHLAWDVKPDLPASMIKVTLQPLADQLNCGLCKSALEQRIKDLVVQWSVIKRTI